MDQKKERILIVEDDESIRKICRQVLERQKYEVYEAENGEEALAAIERHSCDLIMTDLEMPVMGGMELLKRLKSRNIRIPVIVVTGFVTIESAVETMKEGAFDYITKPININELLMSVEKCIENSKADLELESYRQIAMLHEIAGSSAHSKTEDEILQLVLDKALESVRAQSGSILLADEDGEALNLRASSGLGNGNPETAGKCGGVSCHVAREGSPLIINGSVNKNPLFKCLPPRPEIVSSVCLPMIFKDRVIGVINLNRLKDAPQNFSEIELKTMEIFASQAASLLMGFRNCRQLIEVDRLKSEFLGIVSHELRTPLMAIGTAFEMLDGAVAAEQEEKLRAIIGRNLGRMNGLVRDLLDFAKMESGKLKYVFTESSLSGIIYDITEDFREQFNNKSIRFETDIRTSATARIDAERVKQVVSNFLSNAGKFTGPGGSIRLKAEENETDIIISVSDTGKGISKEQQVKIFDRFYQVEDSLTREQGGFGLGLSIVKSIMEAHSGRVWVESKLGGGTTFYASIPKIK